MPQQSRYARRRRDKTRAGNRSWMLIGVAVAIAIVLVVAVVRGFGPQGGTATARTPVPASVMQELTQIPAATYDKVGAKGALPPVMVSAAAATGTASASGSASTSATTSASGTPSASATGTATARKPTVLYIGAEFCPFCAAERWSMITAFARFGTLSGLTYTSSATNDPTFPGTPTFSFYGSKYTSPYIDLQTVETTTNVPAGNGYTPLQNPTLAQQALFAKYDGPPYFQGSGSIPFVLVGGKYAWQGASYSPGLLTGTDQAHIAATLALGTAPAAQAIIANANEISAAICAVDGDQPAAVCNSSGVKAAAATLPKTAK